MASVQIVTLEKRKKKKERKLREIDQKPTMKLSIKFSSLSAPTKIEELTAGSDEKTQRSPAGNRTQGLANSSRTL